MKSLEADKFTDKKCELCNKTLKHNEKVTEVIYCYRCNGIFCEECWFIQRMEEDKEK